MGQQRKAEQDEEDVSDTDGRDLEGYGGNRAAVILGAMLSRMSSELPDHTSSLLPAAKMSGGFRRILTLCSLRRWGHFIWCSCCQESTIAPNGYGKVRRVPKRGVRWVFLGGYGSLQSRDELQLKHTLKL